MLPASRFGLDVFGDIVGRLVACNPDSPVRTDSELAARSQVIDYVAPCEGRNERRAKGLLSF
jgi:hypothetical protein